MKNHNSAHRVWNYFYALRCISGQARRDAEEMDTLNFGPPAPYDEYEDWKPEGSAGAVWGGLGGLVGIVAALGALLFVVVQAVNIMLPYADEVLRNAAR